MGRSASSSKRKSSKPESSKLSHQAKRTKKSRRNKSKKRQHRDVLTYSTDDSMSSVSSSSSEDNYLSSSEDEYKSRKGRLRARDAKKRKKKSRQKSHSPDGSNDPPRSKKRKRSKKDVNSRSKKKLRKTKRRRDVSISSRSSGSHSCSTCHSESSSGCEERKAERHIRRSREKKRYKRDPRDSRSKSRKSRSPSCSSFSRYHHRSCSLSPSPGQENVAAESKSVRLRSVISVVEHQQEEDSHKSDKDLYKEEMIYDGDDYPSSRSYDSPDQMTKRESTYCSQLASKKTKQEPTVEGEEATLPDLSIIYPNAAAAHSRKSTILENQGATEISSEVAGSGNDNMELILRQKALENLKKFRERRQITSLTSGSPESTNNTNNDSLVAKTAVHEKAQKLDASDERSPATDVAVNSSPVVESISHAEAERVVSGGGATRGYPEVKKQKDIHPSLSGNSIKDKNTSAYSVDHRSGLGVSASRQDHGTCSAVQEETTLLEPSQPNISEKVTGIAATLSSLTTDSDNNGAARIGVGNISGSTSEKPTTSNAASSSLNSNSTEQRDESKDGSQFEEKTMSVMRGGEMVQVTYKVYIPKKAPALARRRLKR